MTPGRVVPADAVRRAEQLLLGGGGSRVRRRFPLAPLTSLRVGGAAALYLEAQDEQDLAAASAAIAATGVPWLVIGRGSNVLVSDRGFEGLVIRLGKGFRWALRDGDRLRAGAAMPLPALAGVALTHSLTGLEFGVAIPGSVGGAVRMNAGAHGHAMDEVVEEIELYSLEESHVVRLAGSTLGFGYRTSHLPEGCVVVAVTLSLRDGDREDIDRLMEDARAWRRATQPLAEPNCGSVFKNPPGDHAARLVDAAGAKGLRIGGASVSTKHGNFIVAAPEASASDVRTLMTAVQRRVLDRFGVVLEPEVQLVGEFE